MMLGGGRSLFAGAGLAIRRRFGLRDAASSGATHVCYWPSAGGGAVIAPPRLARRGL
jgi:hypothetical protein